MRSRCVNASSKVRRPRVGEATRSLNARRRGVGAQQVVETAAEDHFAAGVAGAGADVDDPVRRADDRRVVLDDEHRVAVVAQAAEHGDEVIDVRRMEPHGRLVQDVDEIDEIAVIPRPEGYVSLPRLPRGIPAASLKRPAC